MKLIMFGTGNFAFPTFRELCQSRHSVAALVTQPPRTKDTRQPSKNLLWEFAVEQGMPVLTPEDVNTPASQEELKKTGAELFVVADYGQILSEGTLAIGRHGGINLHGSLLPKYRGAAPINWAIMKGDLVTGVTVIQMASRVDAGPCLSRKETPIHPEENALMLESRLAEIGAGLILDAVDQIESGQVQFVPQNNEQATSARRLRKSDGDIRWNRKGMSIKNQIRGLQPWPKTFTYWHRTQGSPMRLIVEQVEVVPAPEVAVAGDVQRESPGKVVKVADGRIRVATGDGFLDILQLQPAGKRIMTTAEFLRGYPVRPGEFFGGESASAA